MSNSPKLNDRIHNLKEVIANSNDENKTLLKEMGAENPYMGDQEYSDYLTSVGELNTDQIIDSHCYGWSQWSQWAQN